MKELTRGNLLIYNIINVDNVVRMSVWLSHWSGKEAKNNRLIYICVHSEIH